jgi:hypothetical protein
MGANGFLDAGNAGAVEVVVVLARLYELVVLYVRLHRLSIQGQVGLIFGFFFIHFVEKDDNIKTEGGKLCLGKSYCQFSVVPQAKLILMKMLRPDEKHFCFNPFRNSWQKF